jgi:aryl sulfotransferase
MAKLRRGRSGTRGMVLGWVWPGVRHLAGGGARAATPGGSYDSSRWDGFVFRADDVVVCAPQKCGTTWVQMICALLIFQTDQLPEPLGVLSPWLDSRAAPLAEVVARLEAQQHRRFIKTHTPLDALPVRGPCTYLCVARDPRDVVISAYHAYLNVNITAGLEAQRAAGALAGDTLRPAATAQRPDFPTWFGWWVNSPPPPANPVGSLSGLCAHLRTSWQQRDSANVILVHYRHLEQHLDSEMRRIAGALGITVDDTAWPSLVRAAGFEAMRSRADELVPEVHVPGHWYDNQEFFHAGTSGQWRTLLSDTDLARYHQRLDELDIPSDFRSWLHDGRLPNQSAQPR